MEMAAEARFQDNIQRKKSIKIITGHIWDIFTITKNEKVLQILLIRLNEVIFFLISCSR